MYGDEETGIPAEELYTYMDGEDALNRAVKILKIVEKLYNEAISKKMTTLNYILLKFYIKLV